MNENETRNRRSKKIAKRVHEREYKEIDECKKIGIKVLLEIVQQTPEKPKEKK